MAEIDGATILIRAKALAAQDGFTWEWDFSGDHPGSLRGKHFLSEERRNVYLGRARAELATQSGEPG